MCVYCQVHRALYQGIMPVAVKLLTLSDMPTHALEAIRSFAPRLSNMSHQLPHPNIVHCCGGNLAAADPFIVMELCSCSLEQVWAWVAGTACICVLHYLCVFLH